MNKKCIGWLLAIPALMGFGLTSCNNDEPILNQEVSSTKQVEVSFIAELGGSSRASLTFNDSKNLKFKWAEDDVVYAVNADNGKYLGTLTVSKVLEDPRNCEFKGALNLPSSGEANLKFYYLGQKGKMEFDSETYLPKDIEVDYSAQTGTADELDDYDLLKAERAYNSTENGKLYRLNFYRHFSTAQFVLKYNNEELELNGRTVTISAADGTLYNKASLNYKSGGYAPSEGNITVTPSTNNFYLNLIPTDYVKFKFTVTMENGDTFEGTKSGKIEEDTYYSDNLDAIVVEMTKVAGAEKTWNVKFYKDNDDESPYSELTTDPLTDPYEWTVVTPEVKPTKDGYEFKGWTVNGEDLGATLTLDPAVEEVKIVAKWESIYKIYYEDGRGNQIGEPLVVDPKNIDNIDLSSAPKDALPVDTDDHKFVGWKKKDSDTSIPSTTWTLTPSSPTVTLVPVWETNYSISFQDEYGNEIGDPISIKDTRESITVNLIDDGPTTPQKTGFEFNGWKNKDSISPVSKESWSLNADNPKVILVPDWKELSGTYIPGYGFGD